MGWDGLRVVDGNEEERDVELIHHEHEADEDEAKEILLHSIDLVTCSGWVLDPVWFFKGKLDPSGLKHSLARLLSLFPALSGRLGPHSVQLSNQGVPFTTRRRSSGSAYQYTEQEPRRGEYVDVRCYKRVLSGQEPLMTVMVTLFGDGTSALGVAMSHVLGDGFSLYTLIALWCELHNQGTCSGGFSMDRGGLIDRTNHGGRQRRIPFPAASLEEIHKFCTRHVGERRTMVRFSKEEVEILRTSMSCLDGRMPTANEALVARASKLCEGDGEGRSACGPVQLTMVANMRGRSEFFSPRYLGNACTALVGWTAAPLRKSRLPELLSYWKNVGDLVREEGVCEELVRYFLGWLTGLEQGLVLPGPVDYSRPLVASNCQIKLPVERMRLQGVSCVRFVPPNLGDQILIVPSCLSDGSVDMYISSRLLDGEGEGFEERMRKRQKTKERSSHNEGCQSSKWAKFKSRMMEMR
eukprot:765173-Hanusia_phi.AAC.3